MLWRTVVKSHGVSRILKAYFRSQWLATIWGEITSRGRDKANKHTKTTTTRDNDCTQRKTIIGKMGSYSVKFEMNAASGNVTSKKVSVALTSSLIIVLVTLVDEKRYSILDLMWRDTTLVVWRKKIQHNRFDVLFTVNIPEFRLIKKKCPCTLKESVRKVYY